MNIFLPVKLHATGGSSTFAANFKQGMAARGHQVHFQTPREYDILLVNAQCPPRHLVDAKLKRKPIIHRLDGVYYPATVAGKKWRRRNLPLKLTHRCLADATIYQSAYSRRTVERFLGSSRQPSRLIYNGVDTDRFSPSGPTEQLRDNAGQHLFITASRFRRHDQIDPLITVFKRYRRKHQPNAKLVIVGDFHGSLIGYPPKHQGDSAIHFQGTISNNDLPRYLRTADAFLFTHQNPPCPNNVLEAMACGLPICGVADGAMTEITSPGNNSELIPASGDAFRHTRRLDLDAFADNLNKIMHHQAQYASASRRLAVRRFDLSRMIDKYISTLAAAVRRNI